MGFSKLGLCEEEVAGLKSHRSYNNVNLIFDFRW